jgi:hypothetical protein
MPQNHQKCNTARAAPRGVVLYRCEAAVLPKSIPEEPFFILTFEISCILEIPFMFVVFGSHLKGILVKSPEWYPGY